MRSLGLIGLGATERGRQFARDRAAYQEAVAELAVLGNVSEDTVKRELASWPDLWSDTAAWLRAALVSGATWGQAIQHGGGGGR